MAGAEYIVESHDREKGRRNVHVSATLDSQGGWEYLGVVVYDEHGNPITVQRKWVETTLDEPAQVEVKAPLSGARRFDVVASTAVRDVEVK